MQCLGARHRDETLLVRASEEDGNPHQLRSAFSSFRDGPKDQTRNLSPHHFEIPDSPAVRAPGMTIML